jgi:hypothetical protein
VITTNMRENMSERIAVEDVWFNNSTNSVDIYQSRHLHLGSLHQPYFPKFQLSIQIGDRRTPLAQHHEKLGSTRPIPHRCDDHTRNPCCCVLHDLDTTGEESATS